MAHAAGGGPDGQVPAGPAERVVAAVALAAAALAAMLVLAMLAITGYAVLMRYVLDTPITWSDELSGHLVVAMVMLGTADALLRGEHISVDLLSERLRGRARRWVAIWGLACVVALAAAIVYSAVIMVRFSYEFGMYSEGYLEAPLWLPQSFVVLGGVLLGVAAVARMISYLRR